MIVWEHILSDLIKSLANVLFTKRLSRKVTGETSNNNLSVCFSIYLTM